MPKLLTAAQAAFFLMEFRSVRDKLQVSAADLTRISKGKAFKSLVEKVNLKFRKSQMKNKGRW